MSDGPSTKPRIGVVGPCKSGKSTLVRGLQLAGYNAIQIAQEHSFAPSMWQQIARPVLLIYLDCQYETTVARGLKWMREEYEEQRSRLANAYENADFTISTDAIDPQQALNVVNEFLVKRLIEP
jgi:deoxyadenosine/deoxycytidine kinase